MTQIRIAARLARPSKTIVGRPAAALSMLVAVGLAVGCGAPAPTVAPPTGPPPTVATSPATPSAGTPMATPAAPDGVPDPLPAAGEVALTGAVRTPGTLTAAQLAALPQQTVDVSFTAGGRPEQHSETGALLADLLPVDALATTDARNDLLRFAVLAVGADGYAALVSYGEISPDFADRGILVATVEDGTPLPRPRLVVPGDGRGGRYVSDLVELRVVRVGP